jgi:hypothetical protein
MAERFQDATDLYRRAGLRIVQHASQDDASAERILQLKKRVDTLREQQHLVRWRRDPALPLWILVFVAVVVAIAGCVTAYSEYVMTQSLKEVLTQLKATRESGDVLDKRMNALEEALAASKSATLNAQETLSLSAAENRATLFLGDVDTYVDQMEQNGLLRFDRPADKRNISRQLKEKIRPVLVDELIYSQMSDLQARMRTKALVKRYLDTVLKQ